MSESFSVGEIAIAHGWMRDPQYNGCEVTVVGFCSHRHHDSVSGYETQTSDGMRSCCSPRQLRKRRPPQDWTKLCNLNETPREIEHV